MTLLAPGLQAFFTDQLIAQRAASPNTISAYRHSFQLLLAFASERRGTPPSMLDIGTLDAPLIAAFLDHLEHDRHNTTATRNNRLSAIHSLFAYLALRHPEHAASVQRVLAIPHKRSARVPVTYLIETEIDALLAAPNIGLLHEFAIGGAALLALGIRERVGLGPMGRVERACQARARGPWSDGACGAGMPGDRPGRDERPAPAPRLRA